MSFIKNYFTPPESRKIIQDRKSRFIPAGQIPPIPATPPSASDSDNEKSDPESPQLRMPPGFDAPGPAPWETRPNSVYPAGDFRNNDKDELRDIKCDVMVNWLYQQQMEMLWTAGAQDEGVVLKKTRGNYTCCPPDLMDEPLGFYKAIEMLHVRSAMTVNTRVIKLFLHNNDKPYVPLGKGLRLQVLPDISYLPRCQKHQFAAFIADRGILVVWDDEPRHLLNRAENIEKALMEMIWGEDTPEGEGDDQEKDIDVGVTEVGSDDGIDGIERADPRKPRRPVLLQPFYTSITICVTLLAIGLGIRNIALQIAVDGSYTRLLLLTTVPFQAWLGLFFFQCLIGNTSQFIGPISQVNQNSKYYSGVAPRRLDHSSGALPHVTIQMPVYKEGLTTVIQPTIHSIKAAMSTYEMQGGSANIFINDDGMQLIAEDEAKARQDFYDEHNIGWVARPGHDPTGKRGEPFVRAGKFKKASNMNYAMWVSTRIEDKLCNVDRHEHWTHELEAEVYKDALMECVEEDQGRTWADGNIRMGDYILIIDSDTRVPEDCLLDAVSEMEYSPEVAILQYACGVMNVTDSFFEKGITFFTNLVYTQIRFAVANGDVAPFVGHNAFLRWSAIQDIAYHAEDTGTEMWWSEATVSEDFDMALRLQSAGYIVRLGGYTKGGYEEGVSLTVYDELARWEKYAFGCNELIFHPLAEWPRRGPFTKLFRDFVRSGIPFPSKCTIMAYIGTYYAIGAAWILTFANYFIAGLFNGYLDQYYLDSFRVWFALMIVFALMGNVALAVLRYRIEEQGLFIALYTNFKWFPLMTVFLGGVSLHVSQALLSHMFGIEMNWGSTAKEVVNTTLLEEVPKIIKMFKGTFFFCFLCAAIMLCGRFALPELWRIDLFISIFPLSIVALGHFLMPIVLNPSLMKFTF